MAGTKLFLGQTTMALRLRMGMLARIRIGKITKKTGMRLGNGRLGVLSKAGSDTDLRRWFQLLGPTDFAISYCADKKKKVGAFGPDHNHLSSGQLRLLLLDENPLDATPPNNSNIKRALGWDKTFVACMIMMPFNKVEVGSMWVVSFLQLTHNNQ